ncbi:MAG TPA: FAD-dependent oxidoreductase, partial [Phototrophicaceae bacterium]|nr:FAD-dependent oxidoreductase [Phototrophicaceae bacterium]
MNENAPTPASSPHIVIIGAGYAGLIAALRLSGKNRGQSVEITLINASDQFAKRPLMHQAAATQSNQPLPFVPLRKWLANTPIHFIQGLVTAIDPIAQVVTTQTGTETRQHPYTYLVYALGSRADVDAVPGISDFAYTLDVSGTRGALALRDQLLKRKNTPARVIICGGGATGIETAAEIKDLYPDMQVTLVTAGEMGTFKTPRI